MIWDDSCRTATISPKTISLPSVQYNKSTEIYPYSVAGFQDSLDSAYPGTCGTKKVILDPANTSDAFLYLTSDTDPLTFAYDMTKTTAEDIGIHTVNYTVEITDYKDHTIVIADSFTFEIKEESFVDQAIAG